MCICLMTLAGCNKVSADTDSLNPKAQAMLAEKYPDARNVKWSTKNGYIIAKFNGPAVRSDRSDYDFSVWFSGTGEWCMTESEISYEVLPEAVKAAFKTSEHSSWRIEDIDRLERAGMETIYVIEVETRTGNIEKEADLYYSEAGALIKTVLDEEPDYDYEDYLPSGIQSDIESVISGKYPGAVIMDVEYDDGLIEVEIVHDGRGKDVYLTKDFVWVRTEWDVRKAELPTAVTSKITADWPAWKIDDAEYVETPTGSWYEIELEQADSDLDIKISPDGIIMK